MTPDERGGAMVTFYVVFALLGTGLFGAGAWLGFVVGAAL